MIRVMGLILLVVCGLAPLSHASAEVSYEISARTVSHGEIGTSSESVNVRSSGIRLTVGPVQWKAEDGGNDHWYEAVLLYEPISWTDARVAAEDRGGYLATLTSEGERLFVFQLVQDERFWEVLPYPWPQGGWPSGPWLGGYQEPGYQEPDEGWAWVTGEAWSYTSWADGEPNNAFPNEDYLQFSFFYDHEGNWNDLPNEGVFTPKSYIVEIEEYLLGACCYEDGACEQVLEADCPTGMWLVLESCDPNPCPPPVPALTGTWGIIKSSFKQ